MKNTGSFAYYISFINYKRLRSAGYDTAKSRLRDIASALPRSPINVPPSTGNPFNQHVWCTYRFDLSRGMRRAGKFHFIFVFRGTKEIRVVPLSRLTRIDAPASPKRHLPLTFAFRTAIGIRGSVVSFVLRSRRGTIVPVRNKRTRRRHSINF